MLTRALYRVLQGFYILSEFSGSGIISIWVFKRNAHRHSARALLMLYGFMAYGHVVFGVLKVHACCFSGCSVGLTGFRVFRV